MRSTTVPLHFIRTLLEIGAAPNSPSDNGFPPLIAALSCTRDMPGATRRKGRRQNHPVAAVVWCRPQPAWHHRRLRSLIFQSTTLRLSPLVGTTNKINILEESFSLIANDEICEVLADERRGTCGRPYIPEQNGGGGCPGCARSRKHRING